MVVDVNCVTLFLSLTMKSPRLLFELSKTRNEFPFTNPCAEEVVKVVDGDTIDVIIDLGFYIGVKKRVRFYGIDTWESRTRDLEEKAKGLKAKAFTRDELLKSESTTLKSYGLGKYGRVLGEIFCDGVSLNEKLIQEGHGYEYHGGKKRKSK